VAEGEHRGASREHGGAIREQRGAEGEHTDETGLSGGVKGRHLSQRPIMC